jgi:hypothetical protein
VTFSFYSDLAKTRTSFLGNEQSTTASMEVSDAVKEGFAM